MKKTLLLLSVCASLTAGAQSPKIEFTTQYNYPEGVAYDATGDVFYVSSARTGSIGKVTPAGVYSPVYVDSTLKSSFGMKVDATGKKLWVCVGDPTYSMYRDSATYRKMCRLIAIDIASGRKVNDIDLSSVFSGQHFPNDLTLDAKGNIYITDSYSPVIYKVDASGEASLFAQSAWFGSPGIGLNGIAWHPSGFLLVANNGSGQLLKVDVSDPRRVAKVMTKQFFPGADGLILDDQQNLILAQNKGTNKIFKLSSTDNWQMATVVGATQARDMFNFPSTIAMRKNEAWVMNSKMADLSDSTTVISDRFALQQAIFVPVK